MAAAPMKSQAQPLHNFSLPTFLKWSSANNSHQRFRRTATSSESPPTPPEANGERSDSERAGSRSGRNHSNRLLLGLLEKPLKQSADPDENVTAKNDTESEEAEAEEEMVQKPWKLRPRRGVNSTPKGGEPYEVDVLAHPSENQQPKSMRLRSVAETSTTTGGLRKEKRRRFWISLSKEEIEEDVYSMTGSRPSRRPKKWPKIVQKQLDNVFPGLWLVGMSADSYRPSDIQAKKK